MYSQVYLEHRDDRPTEDHIVHLGEVSWEDYERLLEIRGDHSAPRIAYFEGVVEIMRPSRNHEAIKSLLGCLIDAYCLEYDVPFTPLGSWTLQESTARRGAEPDECYVFGPEPAERPHLVIEVVWTSGRLDKLEIYRKLGVLEVWYWRRGQLQCYVLRGDRYETAVRSEVLPGLDLSLLTQFFDRPTAYEAIRDFRAALRMRR